MDKNKHLQELINRKPNKWGNITIKEFERDINILQNTILELQEELEKQKFKTQTYVNKWVESLICNFEMMDEYLPEWRHYCKNEINQIIELIK